MEDGSIFVCFLCEREFRQVSLLNQHMTEHGTLPEMSEEFPSRKKTKTQSSESRKNKSSVSLKHKIESREEQRPPVGVRNNDLHPYKVKVIPKRVSVSEAKPKSSSSNDISFPFKSDYQQSQNHMKVKIKEENVSTLPPLVTVKPDPDAQTEFSIAMQRAMKIKKYIERKENTAKRKMELDTAGGRDEVLNEVTEDVEFEGPQESIMMVDSSFFNSGVSKTPIGPTIMNSEPDGFMVPEKVTLGTQPRTQRRKRHVRLKDENFFVQEVLYDEGSTNGFEAEVTNQVQMMKPTYRPVSRGRGRGRGKRGRPIKIKQEITDYEESVLRPGRRSKPRNSSEEISGSYQCPECYKEFRSMSTMRVHMKSHAEVREIPCPYCDDVFPQRYILYEHLISAHEESSNLTCPVCNKIFTRPDSLKSHMVRMHEENGGLNCYVCGKNFPSQGQLEMHVRVHTGERPFKCDICRKGFVQKVHLRTHLRTMHNMTEMNSTPCRICEEMFDGRAGLREHYVVVHGLTTAAYKNQVAKLRKEGKIPEVLPPKVKVVDPSFRYQKVAVTEVDQDFQQGAMTSQLSSVRSSPSQNGVTRGKSSSVYLTRRPGRKLKIKTRQEKSISSTPGMGTVMNLVSDEMMFTPVTFDLDNDDQPRGRDQEELSIVESAFKVAEEMDQMREGSAAILMADDSSSSTGIYYSIPIEDADDEYAQFAAEHAHIDDGVMEGSLMPDCPENDDDDEDQEEMDDEEEEIDHRFKLERVCIPSRTRTTTSSTSKRGAIVKAEPLEIYSDSMKTTQAVEMFTM